MNNDKHKLLLIEKCLEKKLSRFEADRILISHGYKKLSGGEADCYDVIINGTKFLSNPRERIIASSLIKGLSKTEANIALYDAKFRRLNAEESEEYIDVLSRIRYCGEAFDLKNLHNETPKQEVESFESILQNGILNEYSIEEINQTLLKNGYVEMTDAQTVDYSKKYNEYHNKRQGFIQKAYEALKTVSEINNILRENNMSVLTMVEEMKYQKERERINLKKRDNLIKECLEELLETYEINIILNRNGYEKLSEQEVNKINNDRYNKPIREIKRKTSELSNQFRKLYREATKKFHPDRYTNPQEKEKANSIMKELNEAKDKNDYFLLKEIVQKNEDFSAS